MVNVSMIKVNQISLGQNNLEVTFAILDVRVKYFVSKVNSDIVHYL